MPTQAVPAVRAEGSFDAGQPAQGIQGGAHGGFRIPGFRKSGLNQMLQVLHLGKQRPGQGHQAGPGPLIRRKQRQIIEQR